MDATVSHFTFYLLFCLSLTTVYSTKNDTSKCQWGACDQKCINTGDSYKCNCESGWLLQDDGHTCKPEKGEALMIFSTGTAIEGYRLESMTNISIVENLQKVVGVSIGGNAIYWTDNVEETIYRSLYTNNNNNNNNNNATKKEIIVTSGLSSPEDIAVDWITGNIYFTDSQSIGVCNDNGYYCKRLINDKIDKLRGIAVHPSIGKMYWSDWGTNPHIAVSYMDGTKMKIFVNDSIGWPNDLTIDYPSDRVYWVDARNRRIESVDLDGNDRRLIAQRVATHPFSMSVFGNRVYWTDWHTDSINSCNKFNGQNYTTPVKRNNTLYGIHIYHSNLIVKQENPCAENPCSQLCLLTENRNYTCACTMDTELNIDGHTCKRSGNQTKHLVIAADNAILTYFHNLLGRPRISENITTEYISAIAYDSLNDTLFAADLTTHSIIRYDLITNQVKNHIMPHNFDKVIEGIAFDYLGNNLYVSTYNKIYVHSLNTGEMIEFSYPDIPLDMLLIPEEGIMFVVFRLNETVRIDCVQMNYLGSRVSVIEEGLVGPEISLSLDRNAKRVYWAAEGTGRIESMNYQGEDRKVFRDKLTSPVSIAILDSKLFWSSRRSVKLRWTNLKQATADSVEHGIDIGKLIDVPLLQLVDRSQNRQNHPCSRNNGNCSHVCLVTDAKNRMCVCRLPFVLDSDMKSCKLQTTNETKSTCSKGNFSVGFVVGLLVFMTILLVFYYIKTRKPDIMNIMYYRNSIDRMLIRRRSNNLAATSTSTIDAF